MSADKYPCIFSRQMETIVAFDVRRTHPNLGLPVVLRGTLKIHFSSFVCFFCAILNYVMCTCASRFFYTSSVVCARRSRTSWSFVLGVTNEAKGAYVR